MLMMFLLSQWIVLAVDGSFLHELEVEQNEIVV